MIGMTDEASARSLSLHGHHQSHQRQLGARVVAHHPADDLAGRPVEHGCELSASQTRFAADATKSCFSRFGAIDR